MSDNLLFLIVIGFALGLIVLLLSFMIYTILSGVLSRRRRNRELNTIPNPRLPFGTIVRGSMNGIKIIPPEDAPKESVNQQLLPEKEKSKMHKTLLALITLLLPINSSAHPVPLARGEFTLTVSTEKSGRNGASKLLYSKSYDQLSSRQQSTAARLLGMARVHTVTKRVIPAIRFHLRTGRPGNAEHVRHLNALLSDYSLYKSVRNIKGLGIKDLMVCDSSYAGKEHKLFIPRYFVYRNTGTRKSDTEINLNLRKEFIQFVKLVRGEIKLEFEKTNKRIDNLEGKVDTYHAHNMREHRKTRNLISTSKKAVQVTNVWNTTNNYHAPATTTTYNNLSQTIPVNNIGPNNSPAVTDGSASSAPDWPSSVYLGYGRLWEGIQLGDMIEDQGMNANMFMFESDTSLSLTDSWNLKLKGNLMLASGSYGEPATGELFLVDMSANARAEHFWQFHGTNYVKIGVGAGLDLVHARDGYGGLDEVEVDEWTAGPQLALGLIYKFIYAESWLQWGFGSAGNSIQGKDNISRITFGIDLKAQVLSWLWGGMIFTHTDDVLDIGNNPETKRDNSDTELGISVDFNFLDTSSLDLGLRFGLSRLWHKGNANSATGTIFNTGLVFSW